MSGLALQNVVKEFGAFRAVNNVDLAGQVAKSQ